MTLRSSSTITSLFHSFHAGVKAMCEKNGIDKIPPSATCIPANWQGSWEETILKTNECWDELPPILKRCASGVTDLDRMVDTFKQLHRNAMLAGVDVGSQIEQRERVGYVVDTYLKESVANKEVDDNTNFNCFKDELLVDFTTSVTESNAVNNAVIKLAERLVKLLKRLGENVKDGIKPQLS